ncbi:hypothetical protein [Sinorhizobium meliloti]|uniref:hypothetical protein n=1 Tax=Rhizobium meliloti TaxID=382 RepID=UPI0013E357E5|nr:hypothetical protein [Sinorhizobium meliloti]
MQRARARQTRLRSDTDCTCIPLSIAVCPADPKAIAFRVPALGASKQRPKVSERDVVTILSSDGPSVNPLVVVALGAARAEQLIVREIGKPQMPYSAIRIYDSLFRGQIDTTPMAHRHLLLIVGAFL